MARPVNRNITAWVGARLILTEWLGGWVDGWRTGKDVLLNARHEG